ncbi:hypothetical protein ACFFS2_33865 [Streptomyces aurantiacus]|nr:hypothetical protein [Streptomyces aurantiacus]
MLHSAWAPAAVERPQSDIVARGRPANQIKDSGGPAAMDPQPYIEQS